MREIHIMEKWELIRHIAAAQLGIIKYETARIKPAITVTVQLHFNNVNATKPFLIYQYMKGPLAGYCHKYELKTYAYG